MALSATDFIKAWVGSGRPTTKLPDELTLGSLQTALWRMRERASLAGGMISANAPAEREDLAFQKVKEGLAPQTIAPIAHGIDHKTGWPIPVVVIHNNEDPDPDIITAARLLHDKGYIIAVTPLVPTRTCL